MITINSKSLLKANAAANRMVDKYGHDCTVIVSDTFPQPVPATCLFTRSGLALQNGTLVNDNNFKILLKAVALPALLAPLTKIIVNGEELLALKVNKLTPDGVNTILWEIEVAGVILPDDTPFIAKPTIIEPLNNTSFFTSTEGAGGWYVSCQGSLPTTMGDAVFTGSEWQIATDEAFTSIVTTSSIGGTNGGTNWVTDSVLARSTNYYVRTRYVSSNAGFSDWSDYSLFNLDEINTSTVTHITTPTITNQLDTNGDIIPYDPYGAVDGKIPYATTNLANVTIFTTAYEAVAAGDFAFVTFQVATDSVFTNLIVNLTQSEGYGYDPIGTGMVWDVTAGFIPKNYIFVKGETYYARVKYSSVDLWDSEWSDTFTFTLNAAS